jgi:hypothetical protein
MASKSGCLLADTLDKTLIVTDNDPRQSMLDSCDLFVSFNDLVNGFQTPEELIMELNELIDSFS